MKKLYICSILFLLSPLFVNGAELTLKKNLGVIGKEDIFEAILTLNTENESINAIEAVLRYSDNLKLENVSDGNSIINLWISKPKLEDSKNSIFFSGLIPGGIKTSEGTILNLIFKGMASGGAYIEIKEAKVFVNDPEASEAKAKTINLNFEIQNNQTTVPQGQKLILDFLPPDGFQIYLSKDKNIFDNAWFISFNAQDKGSGISHYEIRERFLGLFGDWKKGESPYQLSHQGLFGIIEVRAVDNVGRERMGRLTPVRLYILWFLLAVIPIILIFRGFNKFLNRTKI